MAQTPQWHGQNCLGDIPFGNLAPQYSERQKKHELVGLRIYCATVHNKFRKESVNNDAWTAGMRQNVRGILVILRTTNVH